MASDEQNKKGTNEGENQKKEGSQDEVEDEARPCAGKLHPSFRTARSIPTSFEPEDVKKLFGEVSESRVRSLSDELKKHLGKTMPEAISKKKNLQDYRANPYVLMATSSVMGLEAPRDFAQFLVNNKLYMGLETAFGKTIEGPVMGAYPIGAGEDRLWGEPSEKLDEFAALEGRGLSREEKSRARNSSVWREVDRSTVYEGRRYLVTVKSGPRTINDTQVSAMKDAIRDNHSAWLEASQENHNVEGIDVVLGLTYGTPKTTNNKDYQLINKLLDSGFEWEDEKGKPGVLLDRETGRVRVYRLVGLDFWSFVARPDDPPSARFAFLEVLLALADALRKVSKGDEVRDSLGKRLDMLGDAIKNLKFPRGSLPSWVRDEFSDPELVWLASTMTTFYDEGL